MKTFKIVEICLEKKGLLQTIPMKDGLIINREDEKRTWLIELFLDKHEESKISQFKPENELTAYVTITQRGNDPAVFSVSIRNVQKLQTGISISFDARLRQMRNDYAKQVLELLLKKGLSGESLLQAFTEEMQKRPQAKKK